MQWGAWLGFVSDFKYTHRAPDFFPFKRVSRSDRKKCHGFEVARWRHMTTEVTAFRITQISGSICCAIVKVSVDFGLINDKHVAVTVEISNI
jgi:hypothetical protein